ncbi:MAG: tetratricopeptide repeat protein, partial [Acidobacteriaceae bacterium]|nr:tetratricopeptide repeat protein [Acidobacteriaceae bacterium]
FELLAGCLPYQISKHLPEAVQTIREEDPTRLSAISRTYRGDIETIVGKALEKDKARRYQSAVDLAADIQHYLRNEPIMARPPSTIYQLQKFARRHRGLVAGVAAVFLVLVAGIIVSTWEAMRARRAEAEAIQQRNRALAQEKRADSEAATAKAIDDFLQKDLLAQANSREQAHPGIKADPNLTVRTALDRAAQRVQAKFDKEPLLEASIRETIGNTYVGLGLYPEAQRQLERSLELRKRLLGEEHHDTLSTMDDLAIVFHQQGKFVQAEPIFKQVLEVRRRILGEQHPDTLRSMNNVAEIYLREGNFALAEPMLVRVLREQRRVLGDRNNATLETMNNLGLLYLNEGKYSEAESVFVAAVDGYRRVSGEEHPDTLTVKGGLAGAYTLQGKYEKAEPLFAEGLAVSRRVFGKEHPETMTKANNLAFLYLSAGKYAQAEPLLLSVLEISRRTLGRNHPDTLAVVRNLGLVYLYQGRYREAEPLLGELVNAERRALGNDNLATLSAIAILGELRLDEARYAEAEALFRESLSGFEKVAPDSWRRYHSQGMLGASLAGQKKYAAAEPLLTAGYNGMQERQTTIPVFNRFKLEQAGKWIVQLYQDWGKPAKAAEWRARISGNSTATRRQ